MNAQHTPGPWLLDKNRTVMTEACMPIAEVFSGGPGIQEADANAALIAASPALLALAHQYASECGDCAGARIVPDGLGGDEPCEQCADIWVVIDKAEGRT